jgi:hypothetical protein
MDKFNIRDSNISGSNFLTLLNSKFSEASLTEDLTNQKYVIFSNDTDRSTILETLKINNNNQLLGFIFLDADKSKERDKSTTYDSFSIEQIERLIKLGVYILLTANLFLLLIEKFDIVKIKEWSSKLYFIKIKNWTKHNSNDIYGHSVSQWAYENLPEKNSRELAQILTIFFELYAPRHLPVSERLAFMSNIKSEKLQNGNIAAIYNVSGELDKGWLFYRGAVSNMVERENVKIPIPQWNGEDFSQKRIVFRRVHSPSDEIIYSNIFNDLIRDNCHVIIETDKRLLKLFKRSFPKAEVVPRQKNEPYPRLLDNDIDFQANFSDPFETYRDDLKKFPNHDGYLIPDPKKVRYWKNYLKNLSGNKIKVGISWGSITKGVIESQMTTTLDQWRDVVDISQIQFINLQYGDVGEELKNNAPNVHVINEVDLFNDIESLAAIIGNLDLVISVDNINSNLAGALGTPLWGLIPKYWHLLFGQNYHPFYPKARIFGNNYNQLVEVSTLLKRCLHESNSRDIKEHHRLFKKIIKRTT